MKLLIVLLSIIAITLADHHQHAGDDPHGLHAAHVKCHGDPNHETHSIELEDDHNEGDSTKSHPPGHLGHLQCVEKELKLLNDDGKVNVEGVRTHVGHVITDATKIQEVVNECGVDQANSDATVLHIWRCLRKNQVFGVISKGHESREEEGHQHHHDHDHSH
ncbi:hypothetical protein ABEB36_003277 [Hypothenemus hampei]|uniref:Uncharacterized protein n=1 Tax=Hypothenemus hampei TaxID=57062 RepID=A0ABD1F8L2_HYPHA